jgi:hypothetical protein
MLNVGTLTLGGRSLTSSFEVTNAAASPADSFTGMLSTADNSVSGSVGTLAPGAASARFTEVFNPTTLGAFSVTITLDATDSVIGALPQETLVVAGTVVAPLVPCFAAGTRIATERGEVAIEEICVGDMVRVLLGEEFAKVIWVGRREVDCTNHAQPRKVWPVQVAAGAFGPGRPHTDLFLSPDHAIHVNEVLIPIRYLINGSTIVQVPVERMTYCHLELQKHDVLLAEGLPTESYLDMKDGTNYANRPGPIRLYPDYTAWMWEAFACARLVVTGPELQTVRALVARFAQARSVA